jgi:uncharacterized membrane protein YgdD (TMEM256/DUF423 family)
MRENRIAALAIFLCGSAVALGAMGAHGLKKFLAPDALESFETAVRYQMWHGLALLTLSIGVIGNKWPGLIAGRWLLFAGSILFSGSIYLLSTKSLHGWDILCRIAGPVTPLGGLMLISGWITLGVGIMRK